jgi:hypothetical protein
MKENNVLIAFYTIVISMHLSVAGIVSAADAVIVPQCPETVVCGEEITIPVEIFDSPETGSLGIDIVFPDSFTYERCEKELCLTEDFQIFDCNVSAETGDLRLGGFTITPIPEGSDGCLVNITFSIDDACAGPFIISLTNLVDNIQGIQTESCEMIIESNITTTSDSTTTTSDSTTTTSDSTTTTSDSTTTTSDSTTSSSTTTTTRICPAKVSLESNYSGVEKLRAFRDTFLCKHPLGEKYIALYDKHASEISGYLSGDLLLRSKSASILIKLLPQIDSLLSGKKTRVDPGLLDEAVSFLDQLALRSGKLLKRDLKKIRSDLIDGEMLNHINSVAARSASY